MPVPMLGAFHGVIDTILADDENAPPKQRHTALQVYRRLHDKHMPTSAARCCAALHRPASA
jgi:hypothetical protein